MRRAVLLLVAGAIVSSLTFASTISEALFAFSQAGLGTQQLLLVTTGGPKTLNATSMGWWDSTGAHTASNTNYIAGVCSSTDACVGDDLNHHDFFVFNLASIGSTITSAQLSLFNPTNGYVSDTSALTMSFFDVTTPISTLTASGSGQVAIYNDLGSGTLYVSSQSVNAASNNAQLSFSLTAAGVAGLDAARFVAGTQVAVGGAIDAVAAPVPEPSSMLLFGLGLVALLMSRRLRHCN